MNVSDCYSATHRGVAKLVALRLLYKVMPIEKKIESGLFSQSGSHMTLMFKATKFEACKNTSENAEE